MKNKIIYTFIFLAFALILTIDDAEAQYASVCFYDDVNFQGRPFCVADGFRADQLSTYDMNNKISSVYFYRPTRVRLCDGKWMIGLCVDLDSSAPNLQRYFFNDKASSLAVEFSHYPPNPPPPPPPNHGEACFFEHANFQGRQICLRRGQAISSLSAYQFNDIMSSLTLSEQGRVTVCEHDNFGGACRNFYESIRDLSVFGLNDTISSVRFD